MRQGFRMKRDIIQVLEEWTGLPALSLSCSAQAVSTLLAVVFLDISLSKYEDRSWYTDIGVSIFLLFLSLLTLVASLNAICLHRQDRHSLPVTAYLNEDRGHPAIVLWAVLFLAMNILCKAGMIAGLNIRWEFTEIITVVFDCLGAISCLFTIVVVVQKRV